VELPAEVREDVRGLLGWTRSQEELLASDGVRDRWAVLGQRVEDDGRLRTQRTWLWGHASNRPALVLHFAHGGAPLDASLVVGTAIDAELVFYPGARPLRALVKERDAPVPLDGMPGGGPVGAVLEADAAALAANPWTEILPVVLGGGVPIARGDGWALRDAAGELLPLRPRYPNGWTLRALGGGRPIDVFGEWDGEHFLPLGAWAEGALHAV
jgi:hypothetical protein